MEDRIDRLRDFLRRNGAQRAAPLMRELGVSQPTLSRLLQQLRGEVVRIGRARSARYALARKVASLGTRVPVYRVDQHGHAGSAGILHALESGAFWYESTPPEPALLRGEFQDRLFPGLPYFLSDMRPQGFLGRVFARDHAELGLPPDPRLWSDDLVLTALALRGEDFPGDLVIGEASIERLLVRQLRPLPTTERSHAYPRLAAEVLGGTTPQSSAGGEQPKFAAVIEEPSQIRHVIVKFSPPRDTRAGERWADLLVSEHIALRVLRATGRSACASDVVEAGGRAFLEVTRFDRSGLTGRRGALSMLAIDAAFFGALDDWPRAASRLEDGGFLSHDAAVSLEWLWWFGRFIANSDLHFGNVTLLSGDTPRFELAPAYDMLPMLYAPVNHEIVARDYQVPVPLPGRESMWTSAADAATSFWHEVADDSRISDEFRDVARKNMNSIATALDRWGTHD